MNDVVSVAGLPRRMPSPNSECGGNIALEGNSSKERRLVELLDRCLADMQAGRAIDRDALLAENPELADDLAEYLDSLEFIGAFRGAGEPVPDNLVESLRTLGDYRLIREIGRGGMGVVYEAEQISLARRVALKVLPFAAVLDPRQLQRFKNEALAAASLDHPNIVEVHAVGCERGVHFYAMRYVEGQTLAAVISECGNSLPLSFSSDAPHSSGASCRATSVEIQSGDKSPHSTDTLAAALSTLRTERPRDFFRLVAELGIQAAEALDHAHQLGIVHRDIKPSNLMIEVRSAESGVGNRTWSKAETGKPKAEGHNDACAAFGSRLSALSTPRLYITDFGLARIESDATAGLTMTGDLLGTLRYMSPEQAEGRLAILDHRTDIYSLGITLYELLTLRPAFPAADRQVLLRQIAMDEPPTPRKLNPAIPADLETVLLKSIAKDPRDRYVSAHHMADDLRLFLAHQPIKARPPSLASRIAKWMNRHRSIVASAVIVLVVTAALATVAAVLLAIERHKTNGALAESDRQRLRAEANANIARRAVDDMYTKVATVWLAKETAPSTIQKELISRALEAYQQLAHEPPTDDASRRNVAAAWERIGEIQHFLGDTGAAAEALKRSIDLVRPPVPDAESVEQLLLDLAVRNRKLSNVQIATADWRAANQSYAAGLQYIKPLVDADAASPAERFESSLLTLLGAELAAQDGRLREAEAQARRAIEVLGKLVRDESSRLDWHIAYLRAKVLLSDLIHQQGRFDEAEKSGTEALDRIRRLMRREFHDARELVQIEAEALEHLASIRFDLGRPEIAAENLRAALSAKEQNLRGKQRPFLFELEVFDQRRNMDEHREPVAFCSYAETQLRLAQVLVSLDRPYEAERLLGESVATGYFLCAGEPGPNVRYLLHYARAWSAAADFVARRKPQEAQKLRDAADLIWRVIAARFPQVSGRADLPPEVRHRLNWHRQNGAAHIPDAELAKDYTKPPTPAWKTAFMEHALFFPFNHTEPAGWDTADGAQIRADGRKDDSFYLAMAHHRLGNKEEARVWLNHAINMMGDQPHIELVELRGEAEEMLSRSQFASEVAK